MNNVEKSMFHEKTSRSAILIFARKLPHYGVGSITLPSFPTYLEIPICKFNSQIQASSIFEFDFFFATFYCVDFPTPT